jgi:hypothetical protein
MPILLDPTVALLLEAINQGFELECKWFIMWYMQIFRWSVWVQPDHYSTVHC